MAAAPSDGRCTDRSIGVNFTAAEEAAAIAANLQSCNTYAEQYKCVAQKRCMWRLSSDQCFCTFDGCSCASPVGIWNQSAPWPRTSMALVMFPTFILLICVCSSAFGYIYRKRVSKILIMICPGSVINRLSYQSVLEQVEKAPEVTTEPPEDSDEETEDAKKGNTKTGEKKKKKQKSRKDKEREKREYRGDWMLTVIVERAQHLPRLDSTLRDPSLIGYSGALHSEFPHQCLFPVKISASPVAAYMSCECGVEYASYYAIDCSNAPSTLGGGG